MYDAQFEPHITHFTFLMMHTTGCTPPDGKSAPKPQKVSVFDKFFFETDQNFVENLILKSDF